MLQRYLQLGLTLLPVRGEVSAKRKLVATVAVGTECSVPNVFVDGRSSHRTDRVLSVKSVLVSGRSEVSSSPRPRKRVTFADDTPVSACVSESRRSTQRPRRTNLSVMLSLIHISSPRD